MMHISVNSVAITVVSLTAGNASLSVFGLSACVGVCDYDKAGHSAERKLKVNSAVNDR